MRAEDSRIMGDMKSMKKWCAQLYDINKVDILPQEHSTVISFLLFVSFFLILLKCQEGG